MSTLCILRRLLLIVLSAMAVSVYGHTTDWQEAVRRWMTAEDLEEGYAEGAMEMLEEWVAQPINLNQTTREELEQLPFLTARQVEDLVEFLDRYRPVHTLNELTMVGSLDAETRHLLGYFVVVGEEAPRRVWPKVKDVLAGGHHQLTVTGAVPFYDRKGDVNGYLGYKYRHDLRYQFRYGNRVKAGLTAAQDAGEPFFAPPNQWGYDHYNYYFQLRNTGCIESLNMGMYRVQMGMGLVMNTGYQLGKLASLQSQGRSSHTLTAHSSRSADTYLRGAAATVRLTDRWQVTAFASLRDIDGTLNSDGTLRTIVSGGYHRTVTEVNKKGNTQETAVGGSIGWRRGTLYVHANGVFSHFNRLLKPQKTLLYKRYAAEGSDFFNASIDYGYNNERWSVAGETAINQAGRVAMLHTVSGRMSEQLTLMLLHRYYDKQYTALHAGGFSEGSGVQNEHGIYLGATWQPRRSWTVQGYADYAHFAAPRYQVSAASDAFDALLSAKYQHRLWTVDGRYRWHIRQHDDSKKQRIVNQTEHRLRLGASYALRPDLTCRTQADGVCFRKQQQNAWGVMVGEQVTWQHRWLTAVGSVAWFHTDNYDSRIYQYERSVRYDGGFPMYYGHGLHYALLLTTDISQQLKVAAKLGVTKYFDRATIGSGLQQIDRSSKADLLLQLSYQL